MSKEARAWFRKRGWKPMDFQKEAWEAYARGESGLIAVPTGSGKTYAATLVVFSRGLPKGKLSVLYLTPLRALARHLQASASLLFEVIRENDPENLLLAQARREVLEQQFEFRRLELTLSRLRQSSFCWSELDKPSPFSFALMLERMSTRLSTESLKDRIERMKSSWLR